MEDEDEVEGFHGVEVLRENPQCRATSHGNYRSQLRSLKLFFEPHLWPCTSDFEASLWLRKRS